MRVAVDRDPPFLHRLQERALRLGGRAVDFVREQERGEDRPLDEGELVVLQVEDVRAGDVGRHEIGRELDAVELAAEHPGERPDEERLGHAGHALDQRMAAGENADERVIDHVFLADDDFADFGPGAGEDFLDAVCGHGGRVREK